MNWKRVIDKAYDRAEYNTPLKQFLLNGIALYNNGDRSEQLYNSLDV